MHGRKLITTGTVAALAILAVVGGCREATTGPSSVNPQDFAAALKLLTGNQQTGAVGAALPEPLTVRVVDAGGQPVAGATVLWQVRDGGGTVNPAASTSSISGLATVTWTMGTTLGANKAVAVLQGNYTLDSAVFTATAKTGPAQQFAKVSGDLQTARVTARLPLPLSVNVKDQFGYPVVGVKVTWAPGNIFSGTVVALADSTDATGNVSASWTLGTGAIGQTATATVAGLTPIVFNATGTADTTRVITLTGGAGQSAAAGTALPTQLQVTVKDNFGNPIVGDTVAFKDSLGGGSVNPAVAYTDATGKATTTWTLGTRLGAGLARALVRTTKLTFNATATAQFTQVVAGNYFSCGISTADKAYCWGFGEDGQRGQGVAKTVNQPGAGVTLSDTLTGPFPTWRSIAGGSGYICGISVARQLFCWGKLGSNAPVVFPVSRTWNTLLTFAAVSTSETHSCFVSVGGVLACTGSNSAGQLGDGTKADQLSDYVKVTVPAAGVTGMTWSAVATGGAHTCAFPRFNPNTVIAAPFDSASTSVPWCWGANQSGQTGFDSVLTTTRLVPSPVKSAIPLDSTSLVAGALHTCALSRAGAAFCWGSNGFGQLGKGGAISSTARDSIPQAVAGGLVFSKLYAGEYHTCGITTGGQAYCWGRNNSGQLGIGSLGDTPTPTIVAGGLNFRSLALGELHSCGVTNPSGVGGGTQAGPGVIYCWGDNEYGQLGTGTFGANGASVLGPVKVAGQP